MLYTTMSSARRAAKSVCKKVHGRAYEAYEGVDFLILPDSVRDEHGFRRPRWRFKLTGV